MNFIYFLLLAVLDAREISRNATDESAEIESSGSTIKIMSDSGTMTIRGNLNASSNAAVISFDSIHEKDEKGNILKGDLKHCLESFTNKKFIIGDMKQMKVGTATADVVDFVSTMNIGAKITITACIISNEGVVTLNGTQIALTKGDVKFNVQIEDWPFCSSYGIGNSLCTDKKQDKIGEFLDLKIQIKGQTEMKPKSTPAKGPKDDEIPSVPDE